MLADLTRSCRKRLASTEIAERNDSDGNSGTIWIALICGCSSVVERDLAKVNVESSNLFTRSSE